MHASMNRIYRLIWSHVHQTWVVVHERSRGKGKSANRQLLASVLLATSQAAMAGPTGGQVTAGNATITRNDATTTVTQASQNVSLNWQSFNTASGETVNFVQPSASAIAVNRISDNSATQFYGALNANGQVYLINPNGVVFGSGSQINVGGLVASTLDVSDASLGNATRQFSGAGAGSIINQGAIRTANGGYVALLGNTVRNQGTINAASGAVALGAGSDVTLSFSGNSLVQLQVNQSTLNNLAENGGLVKADGGAVWLSAGAKDAVLASVVNNTGIIEARSVEQVGGTIVLGAGSAGKASNSGTLAATGSDAGAAGGTVKVLGGAVELAAGSTIDVSGDSGGGTALIGGNFLGAGPEHNARTTTVQAGASIKADAITAGNGGNVAVWSDHTTQFDGSISARGGARAGHGGQVETSGKQLNVSASASVSTAAPHGTAGEWLLDPDDIIIGNGSIWGNANVNVDTRALTTALNSGNVTIKTTAGAASCTGTTCAASGTGHGDIIVLDAIGTTTDYSSANPNTVNWGSNSSLTLSAYRDIRFKFTANKAYPGGSSDFGGAVYADGSPTVVLRADNSATGAGTVIFEDNASYLTFLYIGGGGGTAGRFSIYYNPTSYNAPSDFSPFVIAGDLLDYMAVNVTAAIASKTYDGGTSATLTLTPAQTLPSGVTLNTSASTANFDNKNAGTNKAVTIGGVNFGSGGTTTTVNGKNYYINGIDGKTANITKASLAVSGVTAADKTYNATTGATLTGTATVTALGTDVIALLGTGTGSFADANAGANKQVTVSGYTLSGTDAGNYTLLQPALSATINKANLTLTGTKVYDGTTSVTGASLAATGVAGQVFSMTGAGDASNLASKNVQSGAALASTTGLSLGSSSNGGLASNYNLPGATGSSYTVTTRGLTLTGISALDKTYDATTAVSLNTANVAFTGLVAGDTVTLAGAGVGSFANKNVGANKAVTVSGYSLGGTDAGNYVVTQPGGLTATINRANLVVSGIAAANKTYDTTSTATLAGTAMVTAFGSDVVAVTGTGTGSFANANAGSGKAVTVTGYTLAGTDAGNYNVVQPVGVSATINQASVTLSGSKIYDGTTSVAGGTLTAAGVGGQTFAVTGAGDGSNLSGKNVQNGTTLGSTTGLSLGASSNGGLASNYVLSTVGSSYAVTPKALTLAGITALDKTYDATTAASLNTSNVSYSGLVAGDTLTLAGSGTGTFNTKAVGSNKAVTVSGYSLGGSDAGNYVLSQPNGLTAAISKANLVVTGVSAADKTYDGTTSATLTGTATVTGLLGDTVSLAGAGSASFASKDAGANKAVTVVGYTLAGTDAGNYNVLQPAGVSATISKADLLVTGIAAAAKTYDATSAVTLTGTATVSGFGGDVVSAAGTGTGAFADANAGANKAVTVTGYTLAGTDAANYNVLQPVGVSATINRANLALSGSKTYDGTTAVAGSSLTAVGVNGQTFAVTGAGDSSNLVSKNVQGGATLGSTTGLAVGASSNGGLASNYVLSTAGSSYAVTPKGLALTGITALDKTYDATTAASLNTSNVNYTGLVAGDTVTLAGSASGVFNTADAGSNKAVTVSGYTLGGSDAGNYLVAQPGGLTASINRANVTLSGSKTYDGTTSVAGGTLTATGVNGQTFAVTGAGAGSNLASKDVQNGTALGSITGLGLGASSNGGLASNYVLSSTGSSYSVTPKGLALSGITARDKTYDATTTASIDTSNVSYSGLVAGDSVTLAGSGTGAFDTKDAGNNKSVTVYGYSLGGIDAGNYVVSQPAGLSATINKASLVVGGVTAANKTYDATTAATLTGTATVAGLLGDAVAVSGNGSASFASKDAGVNKAVTVTGYTLAGADAANYDLLQPAGLSATINKASLVVSGVTAASKVFDGTTAATVNAGNVTLAGRLGADVITVAATGQFADATAGQGKAVNLSSTYGGADLGNYTITGQSQAFADIIAASVVVPETPVQPPPVALPVQNTVTQLQASLLPPQATAQPQALSLSSTLVVQQTTNTGSNSSNDNASDEGKQAPAKTPIINTTAAFGLPAPMLRIQNGGLQLPLVATSIKE